MDKKSPKKAKKVRNERKSIKYRCDYSSTPLKVLQARGWTRVRDSKDARWDLWWCETSELKLALDGEKRLRPHQRVSHFLNHCELTRKNYLYRNLRRYKRLLIRAGKTREAELCDAMPMTFELPNEYRMLIEEHRRKHGTTWIVKPAAGSQRLKDLVDWRTRERPAVEPTDIDAVNNISQETYVVQKYIDDPYLLGGHKFDLRIYVLVTSFQPLKVWLAREGFARLSGEQFSLTRINDSRVHLTNMAIQLKATNKRSVKNEYFEKRQDDGNEEGEPHEDATSQVKLGRKWPLHSLKQYLTACHGVEAVDQLLQNIAGVIMASLQAVQSVIIPSRNAFELYGYDVIIDERLKPWLLEVNASPSLNATDSADFRLKFDLIDDVLNILDFERLLTGREIRIGGFDLLWDDAPVWTNGNCELSRRLNIFLGAENDRMEQLQALYKRLSKREPTE